MVAVAKGSGRMKMKSAILASLLGASIPAQAAIEVVNVEFSATNFTNLYGNPRPAPQEVVSGKFSYEYDSEYLGETRKILSLDLSISGFSYDIDMLVLQAGDGWFNIGTMGTYLGLDTFYFVLDRNYSGVPEKYYPRYFVYSVYVDDYMDANIYESSDIRYSFGGGVPEPATWAMLVVGFGLVGASIRQRKFATS